MVYLGAITVMYISVSKILIPERHLLYPLTARILRQEHLRVYCLESQDRRMKGHKATDVSDHPQLLLPDLRHNTSPVFRFANLAYLSCCR